MWDIREFLLPAFVAAHAVVVVFHIIGLTMLLLVKFEPVNQRLILINLACTEVCTGASQTVVFALLPSKCDASCKSADIFFYLFFALANKFIMLHLICDRLFDIYLNIKYPIYFNRTKLKQIIKGLWFFSGMFSLTMVLSMKFDVGKSEIRWAVFTNVIVGLDVAIVISALITYIYLYVKVKHLLSVDIHQHASQNNNLSRSFRSKFFLPFLIIATYLVFNIGGDVMYQYKERSDLSKPIRSYLSEVSHLFWILGWLSDAILYVFLQKSIRRKIFSFVCNPQSASTQEPTVEPRTASL